MKSYHCQRCDHSWYPRQNKRPIRCPSCTSAYWDKPSKRTTRHVIKMHDTCVCEHCNRYNQENLDAEMKIVKQEKEKGA